MCKDNLEGFSKIQGGKAEDNRGQVRFVNDFDMTYVKRFYIIKNSDINLIRGWRAHRIEHRWFYVLSGSFTIHLIKIDNWESPTENLPIINMELKSSELQILSLPPGYAMAFRAMEIDSELLVYSDHDIRHAANDDYTWPVDYFSIPLVKNS